MKKEKEKEIFKIGSLIKINNTNFIILKVNKKTLKLKEVFRKKIKEKGKNIASLKFGDEYIVDREELENYE
jgi:hypothetical protein